VVTVLTLKAKKTAPNKTIPANKIPFLVFINALNFSMLEIWYKSKITEKRQQKTGF
jgi:hypothetical protein